MMNYNMQGRIILELFVVLKAVMVEIKKEHKGLMINKITSFKKGKGKKGNFVNGKPVAAPVKNPKNPNPRRSASIRGTVTGSGTASNTR